MEHLKNKKHQLEGNSKNMSMNKLITGKNKVRTVTNLELI